MEYNWAWLSRVEHGQDDGEDYQWQTSWRWDAPSLIVPPAVAKSLFEAGYSSVEVGAALEQLTLANDRTPIPEGGRYRTVLPTSDDLQATLQAENRGGVELYVDVEIGLAIIGDQPSEEHRTSDPEFFAVYQALSEEGKADSAGGMEYERVHAEWNSAGRPEPPGPFIARRANAGPDDGSPVVSVQDIYELEHTSRLDVDQADRVRARAEAFLGLVDRYVHDDVYPSHLQPRVEGELRRLREELYNNADEPLGGVVQSYLTSLLNVTVPLLDLNALITDADQRGIEGHELTTLVEDATQPAASPDDISPAIRIADRATALATGDESATPTSRARWAAKAVGWVSTTGIATAGAGTTFGGVEKIVDLSFLTPEWAAVIGGCLGLAGAVAKIVTDETKPRSGQVGEQ